MYCIIRLGRNECTVGGSVRRAVKARIFAGCTAGGEGRLHGGGFGTVGAEARQQVMRVLDYGRK